MFKKFKVDIVPGTTEHISFSGERARRPTVLIRVGSFSMSKKAFLLGLVLAISQILDGLLTYFGLELMGVHMEGNSMLRSLIAAFGAAPTLFAVKLGAVVLCCLLALTAHNRKWVRPLLAMLIFIYLSCAVLPWTYLIYKTKAELMQDFEKNSANVEQAR